jgi:XTP/dITP diphosphohydrolase
LKSIIVATTNPGKRKEIEGSLTGLGYHIKSLADFENPPDIVEDEETFEGNARKKAVIVATMFGTAALSDDSGLEVDALNGAPGVRSARYGVPDLDDRGRYEHLLAEMADIPVPKRQCRFRCVMVYAAPGREPKSFSGVMEGTLSFRPRGNAGFGYDPVFIPQGMSQTVAELGPEIKNRISHRAKALEAFVDYIRSR